MARVPFIGRLYWREYLALIASFLFLLAEGLIRLITVALPQPIITFCYHQSKNLFNSLSSRQSKQSRSRKRSIVSSVANAPDFVDLCALYGYYAEEHVVQTRDGYLLGVHRLGWRKGEEGTRINSGEGSLSKGVVYMHHGLMMNSEVWVCLTEEERCLPFALVEKGYDVWLGNNRGNKYSRKSTRFSPSSTTFWNFSIDEFAFYDIPDTIDYILDSTRQPSLSYVGFSQGTAQAFATLSIHPTLNDKVDVFVALAPAMSPAGLRHSVVGALIKSSPEVLFLAFGRRSLLSSTTMWQSILYPPIFVRIIDASLSFLFSWHSRNIASYQKLAAYPHLYSYTSVRSVVHWFQIIRNRSFQMFDDDAQTALTLSARDRFYKVAKFPTRNIKTPVLLVYGGSDSLVDIKVMLNELPANTTAREVPHYEHLDFLWANDVEKLVFPHVFEALEQHAGRERFNDRFSKSPLQDRREARKIMDIGDNTDDIDEEDRRPNPFWSPSARTSSKTNGFIDLAEEDTNSKPSRQTSSSQSTFGRRSPSKTQPKSTGIPAPTYNSLSPKPSNISLDKSSNLHPTKQPHSPSSSSQPPEQNQRSSPSQHHRQSPPLNRGRNLHPSAHIANGKFKRDGSSDSMRSLQEKSFVGDGIRLGMGKATVGGVIT